MNCNNSYSKNYKDLPIHAMGMLLCVLWLLSFLSSCRKFDGYGIQPGEENIPVKFSVHMPLAQTGIKTYGDTDNEIGEVDVLVFKIDGTERFSHRSVATEIGPGTAPGEIFFQTSLRKGEGNYRLVVLANMRQQLNAFNVHIGQAKAVVAENLICEKVPGTPWNAAVPMWGESLAINGIDEGTEVFGINLVRSMAVVDVINQVATADFILTDVYVYNSKTRGLVIPNSYSPSLPAGAIDNEVVRYTAVPPSPNELINSIYLFEAPVGSDLGTPDLNATALVVGGKFPSSSEPERKYYYRIDFKNDTNDLVPILRNNRYVINIVAANGTTFAREMPEDAFRSPSLPSKEASGSGRSPYLRHPNFQYTITMIHR